MTRESTPVSTRRQQRPWLPWVLAGFTAWFIGLCLLYGVHAMLCDLGRGPTQVILTLAALWFLLLAGLGWQLARHPWRGRAPDFASQVVGLSLTAASLATLLTLGAPLLLTPCVGL